jgi:formylglycine-generating enzyme required for sulfatase activity
MADVVGGRTCIDAEGVLVPASEPGDVVGPSLVGTFGTAVRPCTIAARERSTGADGSPLFDEEACLAGAMYRMGTVDGFGDADDLPERVAILNPFLLDKNEVTVGRWRAAIARGFTSPDASPTANEGPVPTTRTDYLDPRMCTWSTTARGRETFPLSCVSSEAARAFCKWHGGDLPSEAQWEYASAVASRLRRSRFPWEPDDVVPTCAHAVWGRGERDFAGQTCAFEGFGPLPVDARIADGQDRTPVLGLLNLGASMTEWMRDAFAPMSARCWAASRLEEPGCFVDTAPRRSVRGANWRDNVSGLFLGNRRGEDRPSSIVGFRCVRAGTP